MARIKEAAFFFANHEGPLLSVSMVIDIVENALLALEAINCNSREESVP